MSSTPTQTLAPDGHAPSHGHRLAALDVLRGLAILGTLATNIGIFLTRDDTGWTEPAVWETWFSTGLGLVTDGKWIGLLTIMFGIGLEIQRQSAQRKGDTWLGTYPWRAALLIVDGLLNYIFIFEYDVLMGYGLTGLVVCLVMATTPRVQTWVLGVGLVAHVSYLTYQSIPMWRSWGDFGDVDPALFEKDPTTLSPDELAAVSGAFGQSPQQYLADWQSAMGEIDAWAEPVTYWGQVQGRLENFLAGRGEIPIMFTMGLGLFLVGAFLYRAGIFTAAGARLRMWVMGLAFGVGLPIDVVTRIWYSEYTSIFNRYLTSTMVAFGVLALVAHFYAGGRATGRVGRTLSLVGRMALTCYLAQNLIASVLFYEWGLGLTRYLRFGVFDEVIAWAFVSLILIVMSALWLRRFDRGPAEWVWHEAYLWLVGRTTRRWQARRRQSTESASPSASSVAGSSRAAAE